MTDGMIEMSLVNYLVIGGYLLFTLALGFFFSRKEETTEDYLLGGRKIPWYAAGISFMMSLLSTYSIVMVPGEIFNHGLSMYILLPVGIVFQIIAFSIFVRFYFRLKVFTPYDYLQRRYDRGICTLVSTLVMYARFMYLAMVLFATTKVFEGAAGWPAWQTIVVVGFVGILYTTMGGLKAVIWTDVMQFFVLIGGIGVALYMCTQLVDGGVTGVITYAFEHGRGPERYAEPSFYQFNPYVRLCFWLILIGGCLEALQSFSSDQITIQRLLATDSYKSAKKAFITHLCLAMPFMILLWYIGLAIFSFYHQNPDPRVTSGDTAFFTFIATQLPSPFPGLILAALLAAVMSTLDSGMNSLSTIWVKEFYIKYITPDASEKSQVRMSRISTVIIGVLACGMGILISRTSEVLRQSVVEILTVFVAITVAIMPPFLFAVTTRRVTSRIIWRLTFLCWGISFGMTTWFYISHHKYGLRGPVGFVAPLIPLAVMAAAALMGYILKQRPYRIMSKVFFGISLFALGFLFSMLFWYLFSNLSDGGPENYKLSFKWAAWVGAITFVVLGYVWIWLFGEEPPPEKHVGLTIWSLKEKASKS